MKYVPKWLRALVAGVLITAGLMISFYLWKFRGISTDQAVWGQFGDYVGGILNPLFSITALFALLYTIALQSKELRFSAKQLKRSAIALDAQKNLIEKQTFERTFFSLLDQFNGVVRDMQTTENSMSRSERGFEVHKNKTNGRECIKNMLFSLKISLENVSRGNYNDTDLSGIDHEYSEFYLANGHQLGHYFRTVYNIIKFVDNSSLSAEEKKFYTNLVRAQLSKYELGLIFYNCISRYGKDKFMPLVIKYNLLKHLEDDVLRDKSDRIILEQIKSNTIQ
jgi:hypothetical protein